MPLFTEGPHGRLTNHHDYIIIVTNYYIFEVTRDAW